MRQGDIYVEVIEYPLARAETKADVEAYRFPDPDAPGRFRDAEALVKKYKNDCLIFGDIEVTVFSQLTTTRKAGFYRPFFELS